VEKFTGVKRQKICPEGGCYEISGALPMEIGMLKIEWAFAEDRPEGAGKLSHFGSQIGNVQIT
jgi:hypothetical protein